MNYTDVLHVAIRKTAAVITRRDIGDSIDVYETKFRSDDLIVLSSLTNATREKSVIEAKIVFSNKMHYMRYCKKCDLSAWTPRPWKIPEIDY